MGSASSQGGRAIATPNDNGSGGTVRLLWWMLGIQATLLLTLLTLSLNQLSAYQARVQALELSLAGIASTVKYTEALASSTRQEQLARSERFADITAKLLLLDQRLSALNVRLTYHEQRLPALLPHEEPGGVQ